MEPKDLLTKLLNYDQPLEDMVVIFTTETESGMVVCGTDMSYCEMNWYIDQAKQMVLDHEEE